MITHHRKHFKWTTRPFQSDCKDIVELWNPGRIIASFLASGVASAKALSTPYKLGCWLAKKMNATSLALSRLLLDVDSIRHATLRNRTAIDFLLLAQDHGCQDFDGMSCMNLSDDSESVHEHSRFAEQSRNTAGWQWMEYIWGSLWGSCRMDMEFAKNRVSLSHCFSSCSHLCSVLIAVYTENDTKCY